jgi:hypothetical protein
MNIISVLMLIHTFIGFDSNADVSRAVEGLCLPNSFVYIDYKSKEKHIHYDSIIKYPDSGKPGYTVSLPESVVHFRKTAIKHSLYYTYDYFTDQFGIFNQIESDFIKNEPIEGIYVYRCEKDFWERYYNVVTSSEYTGKSNHNGYFCINIKELSSGFHVIRALNVNKGLSEKYIYIPNNKNRLFVLLPHYEYLEDGVTAAFFDMREKGELSESEMKNFRSHSK